MVESSLSLQLVDVGTAANVLLVHGTSLGQDNGWELHVPSEVCLLCTYVHSVCCEHFCPTPSTMIGDYGMLCSLPFYVVGTMYVRLLHGVLLLTAYMGTCPRLFIVYECHTCTPLVTLRHMAAPPSPPPSPPPPPPPFPSSPSPF